MSFGLDVRGDLALPGLDPAPGGPVVTLEHRDAAAVQAAFSGPADPVERGTASLDGLPWTVERGAAGDLLLRWGDHGAFHLDVDGGRLLLAGDAVSPAWQRVVLDSVLVTVALSGGAEALHAAVVLPAGVDDAVALLGAQGAGKTSTATALLQAGGRLVADDVAALHPDRAGHVLPAPRLLNVPRGTTLAGAELLHRFDDEDWVLLGADRAATTAVPLRAVVLLDRSAPAGTTPALGPLDLAAPVLLAHALDSGRRRQAARLARLAALADVVPLLRLHAPPEATPDALAAVLASS